MGVLRVRTTMLHFLQAVGFHILPSYCREERILASVCQSVCLPVHI